MTMIASRRRSGYDLAQHFQSLAGVGDLEDRPVTLPPGRARLATRPVPTGSPATANTIGMSDVARFAAGLGAGMGDDDINVEADELREGFGGRSLRPSAHR